MKLLLISDVHADGSTFAVEKLPQADVALMAGDITNYGALRFSDFYFAREWMKALSARMPVFWVPGNHDLGMDNDSFNLPGVVGVRGRVEEFQGIRIGGVSHVTAYDIPALAERWAYTTIDPEEERQAFNLPPVDILISHSPPHGVRDTAPG